ncbi:sensory histidine kinase AtoS [bacterium BMS3Bbin07]|nr:sensory histidine kinase AtoS [bacterium BMS3Bbin07]
MKPLISILYLIASITVISHGVMVYLNNRKSRINMSLFLFCLASFFWLFFAFLATFSDSYDTSLLLFRICYVGIVFIPSTFYQFAYEFVGRTSGRRIAVRYLISTLFAFTVVGTRYMIKGLFIYPWGFYPAASSPLHIIFMLFFLITLFSALNLIYKELKKKNIPSIQRTKLKYIFTGLLVASLASVDFLGNYGIPVMPLGFVFMSLFTFILTYATLRHQLLDIRVALARLFLLFITAVVVTGTPFLLGIKLLGPGLWIIPVSVALMLAATAPLLYIYIGERTENLLLKQQRRYQQTLLYASHGMLYKRDLNRLLKFVVILLTLIARLRYAAIYLFDGESNSFQLKAERPLLPKRPVTLDMDNPVVKKISKKEILNRDELLSRGEGRGVVDEMQRLNATIIIPCCTRRGIVGFLVFGNKRSGQHFSSDEIDTFLTLSNQFALAIENALYLKDLERAGSELFHAAKMSSLGTMASGLGHQINNRLHTILLAVESLNIMYSDTFNQRGKELVSSIVNNIRQAEDTIEKLRNYSKTSSEEVSRVSLKETIESAFEMMRLKRSAFSQTRFEINVETSLKVLGNLSQLREVFFNLLDNADTAIRQSIAKGNDLVPMIRIQSRALEKGMV